MGCLIAQGEGRSSFLLWPKERHTSLSKVKAALCLPRLVVSQQLHTFCKCLEMVTESLFCQFAAECVILLPSHTAACWAGFMSSFHSAVGLASLFLHTTANRELGVSFCNCLLFACASWAHKQGKNITGCPIHCEADPPLLFLCGVGLVEVVWYQQRAGSLHHSLACPTDICISSPLDVGGMEVEGACCASRITILPCPWSKISTILLCFVDSCTVHCCARGCICSYELGKTLWLLGEKSISITSIYYLIPMETIVLQGVLLLTFFLSMEKLLL